MRWTFPVVVIFFTATNMIWGKDYFVWNQTPPAFEFRDPDDLSNMHLEKARVHERLIKNDFFAANLSIFDG